MSGAWAGSKDQWIVRGSVAGLLAVLCFLAGFSVFTQRRVAAESKRADTAARLSTHVRRRPPLGHRGQVARAPLPLRGVQLGPRQPRRRPSAASADDLQKVLRLDTVGEDARDRQPAAQAQLALRPGVAAAVLGRRRRTTRQLAVQLDHQVIDPIFGALEYGIHLQARAALGRRARAQRAPARPAGARRAARSRSPSASASRCSAASPSSSLRAFRRQPRLARLAQIAVTDPLTGLRNHRAFQEDLARELQRVGRTGIPLALVMLDLDGLKAINDQPRPPGRRRAPPGPGRRDPRQPARDRPRLPHRRRRVRGHPPRLARARRARVRASACARWRRSPSASPRRPTLRSPRRRAARGRPGADRRQAARAGASPSTGPTSTLAERRAGAPRAARWPARSRWPSTPRTPTPAATARPSRSCAR